MVYANAFTKGHRTEAMAKLRVPVDQTTTPGSTFFLGLNLGLSIGLFVLAIYLIATEETFSQFQVSMRMYRMVGMVVLMIWAW
jgi:hypothetical protein